MSTGPNIEAPTRVIQPVPDSRLEQLLAQYDLAKAEADKAAETLKAIADGVKAELAAQLAAQLAEGETAIEVASDLLARPLRLSHVESWRVDAKKLKTEDPLTYVRYATKSSSWKLAPVGSRT